MLFWWQLPLLLLTGIPSMSSGSHVWNTSLFRQQSLVTLILRPSKLYELMCVKIDMPNTQWAGKYFKGQKINLIQPGYKSRIAHSFSFKCIHYKQSYFLQYPGMAVFEENVMKTFNRPKHPVVINPHLYYNFPAEEMQITFYNGERRNEFASDRRPSAN